ncbi:MAG: hypothetical protein ACHQ50_13615 [Fimbriimonadales bacterium]
MLAALSLLAINVGQGPFPSETLSKSSKLTCRDWAETANFYIGIGEERACANLIADAGTRKRANTRVCLLSRVLFTGKNKSALRPPALGDLSLPPFPLSDWPEFPLVQQDGVWLELDENYRMGTVKDTAASFVDYCRKNGQFRTAKVAVPTHQQAVDALNALQGTKRWRAIRWSDSDLHGSYTYDRSWTVDLLRSQTHFSDSP